MRLAASIITVALVAAKNSGSINVSVDGVDKQIYVVGSEWAAKYVKVENNGFSLNGGGRIYFSEKDSDDFTPDMYW